MMDFDTTENDRRIANIAQMGVVEEVNYASPPKARIRIGGLLTGWMRMGTRRAGDAHESWGYSVGEEVLVVSTSAEFRNGVIVCALANGKNPAQAGDGVFKTVYPGGVVITISGGNVEVVASGNITLKGARIDLN